MKTPLSRMLFATTAVWLWGSSALAQESQAEVAGDVGDIVVTARRSVERLQDVPISISVLSQNELTNNNVSNIKDIAALTPGLNINSRNGPDATNFSIRGFTQEQRTAATVGVYFADVVAPRGSGASFGGDGSGPGAMFDLQNVQVLKGPQGTLQGRNSTGGAVLLVPVKPTDRFEGYVEGSIGEYDMRRAQAVVNIPLADTFRVRIGGERNVRHGYLENVGNLGDGANGRNKGMADVDYWTGRLSIVADLTPDLENYTIASYTKTESNGAIPKVITCNPGGGQNLGSLGFIPLGDLACAQIARESTHGKFAVSNRMPDSFSSNEQWQIINTVTWQASDTLTVKNILAYGEYRGTTNLELFGNYALDTAVTPGTETSGSQITGFALTHAEPFRGHTNAQSSFVGEFQLQGRPADGRFIWQAGIYTEINDPLGASGIQTASLTACADISTFDCVRVPSFSAASANFQTSSTTFRNYAAYGQATYDITDQLKFTAGLRYTRDEQTAEVRMAAVDPISQTFNCANPIGTGIPTSVRFPVNQRMSQCGQRLTKNTEAPTWLIGLDYKPIEDILLYAKWSRGYRQGGLSLFGPDTLQPYDKEKVEAYEIGAKTSWRGPVPGTFNISGFYNDFTNQQLLLGIADTLPNADGVGTQAATASVVNAGKSRLYGFEAELNVRPFEGFRLSAQYAYLNTKLQEFVPPTLPAGSPYDTITPPAVGSSLPNSQPHKLNLTVQYTLPLPESIGEVTLGGTYIYTGKWRATNDQCPRLPTQGCIAAFPDSGMVPSTNVFNLNVNWNDIAGMPVDASFFMTNVTNEVVYLTIQDGLGNRGFRTALLGEPSMYGFRVRYRFGQ